MNMVEQFPRRYMLAKLHESPRAKLVGTCDPAKAGLAALTKLMFAAYRGRSIDYEGRLSDAALTDFCHAEMYKTLTGEYGALMTHSSQIVMRNNEIVHATLVTRWENRPFVVYAMTAPAVRRIGIARACLTNAMQDLLAKGESELGLMVTLANLPARTLYESLGFVVQD